MNESMNEYSVFQDGGFYNDFADVNTAVDTAEELLGGVSDDEKSTFTVRDSSSKLLASMTNRRIVGMFVKTFWSGRKDDNATNCGEVEFDATDVILLMRHDDLIALSELSEMAEQIGKDHIGWDGPCCVYITDEIASYFGVNELKEITPEALKFARERHDPKPATDMEITLEIKIKVKMSAGASLAGFIADMNTKVESSTPGVIVSAVETMYESMQCAPVNQELTGTTASKPATTTVKKNAP